MITLLIGVIISIPIGIGINLATPWVRTAFSSRNKVRQEKRIKQIQAEYIEAEEIRSGRSTNRLIARGATWLIYNTSFLLFATLGGIFFVGAAVGPRQSEDTVFAVTSLVVAEVSLIAAGYAFVNATRYFEYIYHKNDNYRKRSERTLRRLHASLPDIAGTHARDLNSADPSAVPDEAAS